ncbi:MAG: Gfo/Idh/MocA family oxidoreductase [Chloroflexi bacterium]|nr:Gfo/Idh/MocA family oxidoreductase [Chloroflexota bacterium]
MTYKLAMIGASGHIHLVLPYLSDLPQVRFCAYAPSFPGEDVSRYARSRARDGLRPQAYDDWRELLDTERPDIVVPCGRNDTHAPIAIEAVRRGCHVFSEKPAAQTLEDVLTLRQLVRDQDVRYGLMLPLRYKPAFFTARLLVENGIIGEPFLISAQKSYRWGDNRPEWYGNPAHYGNSITWIGIHALDFARWIAGVEYAEVYGYHANLVHTERPGCQDVSTLVARLTNGGSATFHFDYLRPASAITHGDDRVRVAGSEGVLEVYDQGRRLHVIAIGRDEPNWPLVKRDRALFVEFVESIEGRVNPLITAEEAFSITAFAILAAQAADQRRPLPFRFP